MRGSMIAVVLVFACTGRDEPTTAPSAPAPSTPAPSTPAPSVAAPGNVVQQEMRMLTEILASTVRGIGAGDVRSIEHDLHRLHAAKQATTAAVRSGAYRLPTQPENVAQFEALDEAFHEHLGALVTASRANDVPAAAEALGAIVRGCQGCHAAFRAP